MRKIQYLALATAFTIAMPGSSMATNGYFSHGYGAKSKAMAGAGVAMSMDAMAAATNPAGMAGVGNRLDFGADLFVPDRDTDFVNGMAMMYTGNYEANERPFFIIPEFGYNRQLNDKVSLGVTVYGNGGMNTKYDVGLYSQIAGGTERTGIDLAQLFIAPTVTYKINDNHAVGASVNLVYQRFKATGMSDFAVAGFTPSGTANNLSDVGYDDSFGMGVKLGWTGKVSDTVTLGATYQSRTHMSKLDKYKELFAEGGDFDIPSHYTIGAAWKATPKTTIAFDIQRINYGSVKSIANANNNTMGQLGMKNGRGFGWDDMTIFKLGVEHEYSNALTLRAGISHGDQPIGHDDTDFNAVAPAVIEDHLTLGATWTMDNGSELTAHYMHGFENSVSNKGQGMGMVDKITMSQDSVGVSYGWAF